MTPVLDRVRLETATRAKSEDIHANLLGCINTTDPRAHYRGPKLTQLQKSWDAPKDTPGGLYLQTMDTGDERIVTVEYNPQHAPWKYEASLAPLADFCGSPLQDWWVKRYDVAYDFFEPRERFTLTARRRRKVKLIFPIGGKLETAVVEPTDTFPGVMIYDKAAERTDKGDQVDIPWTRVEIKVKPKNRGHVRWGELGETSLPPLGASVKRFHYEREDYDLDKQTSLHFAHLQELATYNPERARMAMRELAATKGLGDDAYDCLLDDVQLERAWDRSGRDAVEVVTKAAPTRHAI